MSATDNWGWRARIGIFIVGNEAVPEAEWWAMLGTGAPPGVSVHAARVTARAPWLRWRADKSGVEPEEDLLRGCRQFAGMRLEAVTIAHTSSSVVGGKGWDAAAVASLTPLLGAGVFVTTNGLDTQAALRAAQEAFFASLDPLTVGDLVGPPTGPVLLGMVGRGPGPAG